MASRRTVAGVAMWYRLSFWDPLAQNGRDTQPTGASRARRQKQEARIAGGEESREGEDTSGNVAAIPLRPCPNQISPTPNPAWPHTSPQLPTWAGD